MLLHAEYELDVQWESLPDKNFATSVLTEEYIGLLGLNEVK
jgi:hypothetical protein